MAIKEIKREWSPEQLGYVKRYLLHTEADVKDLPKCCVGSIAMVSETNREYICTGDAWEQREKVQTAPTTDIDEIVAAVIEALPNASGVSF